MSAVVTSTDIKTLLKLALPIGSRLLTGYPATPVSWVSHLRTRPPIFADIEGRELILVSTEALGNYHKPLSLETVIDKLTQTQASAICVEGTLTPRAQQIARLHNFPLIALPDRAVLPQVERSVQRLLTEREVQLTFRASELQQTLQRHAASRRGLTTMLNVMARMLDRPVVIHDRRGNVLSRGLPGSHGQAWDAHLALAGGAEFVRRFDLEDRSFYEDDWQVIESPAGITAPLISDGRLLGYVSILSAGDAPDDFDLMALESCAAPLVREISRQQSIDISIEPARPTRDWVSDWLSDPGADEALLALRAEKDGFQAGIWYALVLFQWIPSTEHAGGVFSPERMVRLIQSEMHQRRIQAPVGYVRGSRRAVLPAG